MAMERWEREVDEWRGGRGRVRRPEIKNTEKQVLYLGKNLSPKEGNGPTPSSHRINRRENEKRWGSNQSDVPIGILVKKEKIFITPAQYWYQTTAKPVELFLINFLFI